MQEVNWEVRQMSAAEIHATRRRSTRMNSLRKKMEGMEYGHYVVVPQEVFDHGTLRKAVHLIAKDLNRGRFRCMKDKETNELRVLFLGE